MGINIDVIKRDKKAEEKADKIIEDSVNQARDIVMAAEKNRQLIIEEALESGEIDARELSGNKEKEAREEIQRLYEAAEEEVQLLKKEIEPRIKAAVDAVIERIVKIHGNS